MPKHAVEILEWLPFERGTLLGFAKIRISELRLIVKGVTLHQKNGSRLAQLPSKPMVQDGQLIQGSDGRVRYVPVLEFTDRETASAFSCACWAALEAFRQS
jgi:hypothetical protein